MTLLRSFLGAALSFLRTGRALALENLALRHQIGVLKRTVGKRRLRLALSTAASGLGFPASGLDGDAPEPRAVQGPELGKVIELPRVGGLQHVYVRKAA